MFILCFVVFILSYYRTLPYICFFLFVFVFDSSCVIFFMQFVWAAPSIVQMWIYIYLSLKLINFKFVGKGFYICKNIF